eukprot:m.222390 g.222390  ORF g.222390 m.222390 type:complete len:91 (+) comp15934_c1_seq1:672-944(+)
MVALSFSGFVCKNIMPLTTTKANIQVTQNHIGTATAQYLCGVHIPRDRNAFGKKDHVNTKPATTLNHAFGLQFFFDQQEMHVVHTYAAKP